MKPMGHMKVFPSKPGALAMKGKVPTMNCRQEGPREQEDRTRITVLSTRSRCSHQDRCGQTIKKLKVV